MPWGCVWKLKNSMNEYYFAVIPPGYYTGPQPGGTIINQRAYRESNSETPGNVRYTEIRGIVEDISGQAGIERRGNLFAGLNTDYTALDRIVYSDIGGSGAEYDIPDTTNNASFSIGQFMYKAFNRTETRRFSGSFNKDSNRALYSFVVPMMFVNDETEEIYSAVAFCSVVSANSLFSFDYYDSAQVTIYVADGSSSYNLWDIFNGSIPSGGGAGPYDDGGNTQPGGGGGDFTPIDDVNPVPLAPAVDLAENGLFTIYNPTDPQITALGNFLWTGLFDVDNFKKLFNDPMQAIISLGIIPGGTLSVSENDKNLIFGHVDTGVDCKVVTSQWLEVDCGFVTIPEFWGNYLDYNPYTKLRLYLPYIGEIDLNADDVIGPYYNDTYKNIGVVYHIDVITGACVAYVTRGEGSGVGARNDVFYTATGNVLMQIPITGNDFKGAYSAIIGIAGAAIAGGTAAAAVKGATAGTIGAGAAVAGVSAAVSNVTSEKESVRHSGNMAGTAGLMGPQTPYIYIDRPSQAEPYNQGAYTGYPSLIQHDQIGDLSGFTIMYAVKLEGIHATKSELEEIERHLLEGVYL